MAADAGTAGSPDAAWRALVGGCALLLVGDVERADRLSQTVLARQASAAPTPYPPVRVLRELVRPSAADFEPPWVAGARVELRDAERGPSASPLLAALQGLPVESRAALVLTGYAGLTTAEAAEALDADGPTTRRWADEARRELASQRPDRWSAGHLDEELRTVAARAVVSGSPATDASHGRLLARRRGLSRAAAVVAVLVLVLGAVAVLDPGPEVPQAASTPGAPAPSPIPTRTGPEPLTAACDLRDPLCQATVMRSWRITMSDVVASHLDPENAYFTGYSFSYDPRFESRSFWAGGRGALGLEVARLGAGATEVYLQVASGYDTAVRCGATTGRRCEGRRFRNGDRFTLSTTSQVERGIEVQHRPDGGQVITVVARNTTRGQVLDVTRADLIELVQDPRLRLPVI